MSEYMCFLIHVLYKAEGSLITCALKVKRDLLSELAQEYPEDATKEFYNLLPGHVKSCGPIVKIEPLFEVHEVEVEKNTDYDSLAPCPFCGKDGVVVAVTDFNNKFIATCEDNCVRMPFYDDEYFISKEVAKANWNRRGVK